MSNHRTSYKKTTILAVGGGTISLLVSLSVLQTHGIGIPGTELNLSLHPLLAWSSGLFFLGLALVGYTVALGGMLALRYDAKGRAVF